jgi:hypothetical protein
MTVPSLFYRIAILRLYLAGFSSTIFHQVPDDKFRRSSEDKKRDLETTIDYAKLRQRRKSTPIKCREIYDVSNLIFHFV